MGTEDKLIQQIARTIPSQSDRPGRTVRLGIGDDGAILKSAPKFDWVVSCDNFIEGVHFWGDIHPPDSVGYKSLVRSTSDLLAMGASPNSFIMGLALTTDRTGRWLNEFLRGMGRAARLLRMRLIGGDTTASRIVSVTLTVFGQVAVGQELTRSQARPGDRIYVSGTLGRAQLGLEILRALDRRNLHNQKELRPLLGPHLYPTIEVKLGLWLARNRIPSAMMDLSDGLSTDLGRLCTASGVAARLWVEKIPAVAIAPGTLRARVPNLRGPRRSSGRERRYGVPRIDALQMALHGGDDYGLLFTVPPAKQAKLDLALARRNPRDFARVTCIGEICRLSPKLQNRSSRVTLVHPDGRSEPLNPGGWDPFAP